MPVAQDAAPPSLYGLGAAVSDLLCTAKVFPGTSRGKTFELKEPVRLRART